MMTKIGRITMQRYPGLHLIVMARIATPTATPDLCGDASYQWRQHKASESITGLDTEKQFHLTP